MAADRGTIASRVDELRAAAAGDPAGAQDELWDWISQLGADRDTQALEALFEAGAPPPALDGPAEGRLLATVVHPLVDLPVKLVTSIWMPWRGKVFDAARGSGINRLTAGSVLPVSLLWPLYKLRDTQDGLAAFEFVSGPEPGKIAPRVPVMTIDYGPVAGNPHFVIRQIRDELVELVPGTQLGRILFRLPALRGERYANIGYFALRQPAAG